VKPWATVVIAAATAVAYLWLASRPDAAFNATVESWGARRGASTPIAFVASPIVHATATHLLLNLLLFLSFAPAVEKRVAGWGLALIYVLSGAAGVAAHLALGPGGATLIGASGAVSGVLGAHLVKRPWGKISLAAGGIWAAANLAGWLLDRGGAYGISYLSHLGGLAAGALISAALPASRPARPRKGS
jgi:membrane associated rhomboid family serine protease